MEQNKPLILSVDKRGVCTLTLDRPDKHNALNRELIEVLTKALVEIENEPGVRVVVITGSGESFCSGADLQWMAESVNYSDKENQADAMALSRLMSTLYGLSKPTIALINGHAFGGALGLVACCDIAIAVSGALFSFSEVRLGLTPAVISPYIVNAIGARQAKRLFLTAERFSAEQALDYGLVHQLTVETLIEPAVEAQIGRLLKAGPQAITESKALVQQLVEGKHDAESLAALIARLRASDEGQEGLKAFLEKRPPNWVKPKS